MILAETDKFILDNDYEKVFLIFKNRDYKKILVGDFYGDPQTAIISENNDFCVIGGCGMIIYYLKDPYEEYKYNVSKSQWKDLFRDENETWWIEKIEAKNASSIYFTVEQEDEINGGKYELDVYSLELKKCNL